MGAALAWRIAYVFISHGGDRELFDEGDAFFYGNVADNLARGHWFVNPFNGAPAADHPPITVLVLGPAAWLFDGSVLAQRLTMAVIGTVAVVAIGLLAREVAGPRAGVAAAAVAALSPNLWMNDAVLMSEAPSAVLIAAVLWAGWRLARRPSIRRAAVAGALCGLTVLARAEIGLFLPLLIVPVLATAGDLSGRTRLAAMGAAAAATVAVVAPWTLWNLARFEDPVLVSTNDGGTLYGANCPSTYDSAIVGGWSLRCVLDTGDATEDASQTSTRQRRLALHHARTHLGRLPVVLIAREGRTFGFWRPDQLAYANQGEGRPRWASWAGFATFWVLVPVSVAGAMILRRRAVSLAPVMAALATVVLVSALFYGIPRFRLPLDVVTCVLAGVVLDAVLSRGSRPAPPAPPDGGAGDAAAASAPTT